MTDCSVVCEECRTPKGPKVWHHGCIDCATDQLGRHHKETGHNPELSIREQVTIADIQKHMRQARRLMRRGW